MKGRLRGFTLIELMIVMAIIALLASIAIPQYQDYVSRTRASGAMAELSSYRTAVGICAAVQQGVLSGCSAGSNGLPATPAISTLNIVAPYTVLDGVITATSGATASSGGAHLTIINTPSAPAGAATMVWTNYGTICNASRGLKPGQGNCP